ncbi:PIN domain-containing protein [Maricaulaceae bacterium MS644]
MSLEIAADALGLDLWGAGRLVELGDIPSTDTLDAATLNALRDMRVRRRAAALDELVKLDGPHLAPSWPGTPSAPDPAGDIAAPDTQAPSIFIDACVLAGAVRRHLVLAFAEAGLLQPRWSPKVLFETGHAHAKIVEAKPGRDGAGEAARLVVALEQAWPEASVPEDHGVEIAERLPDEGDRHVMESAIACGASLILTDNIKDFPRKVLEAHGLYARTPAEYFASRIGADPGAAAALMRAAVRLKLSPAQFARALQQARLGGLAKRLGL